MKKLGKSVKNMEVNAVKGNTPKFSTNNQSGKVANKGGTVTIKKINTGRIPNR